MVGLCFLCCLSSRVEVCFKLCRSFMNHPAPQNNLGAAQRLLHPVSETGEAPSHPRYRHLSPVLAADLKDVAEASLDATAPGLLDSCCRESNFLQNTAVVSAVDQTALHELMI